MLFPTTAAYIFGLLTSIIVAFQLALSLGAPLGDMAMGGKFPGRFPPQMRVAALVQAVLLVLVALVVLTRAGLVFSEYFVSSKTAIWFVVAFCLAGTILNIITPSKKERMIWGPVTTALLICCFVVARS